MIVYRPSHKPIDTGSVSIIQDLTEDRSTPSTRAKIDSLWDKELEDATLEGKQLFDAPVYSLVSHSESMDHDILTLRVGKLPFKTRFIAKKHPDIGESLGNLHALFTHILLRTDDDFYVFGEKSTHFVTDLTTCFIGGAFDYGTTLTHHAYKEIGEELGIKRSNISQLSVIGIYQNLIGNTGIILEGYISMNSNTLKSHFSRWLDTQDTPELSAVTLIPKSELYEFMKTKLSNYPDVRSIAGERI